MLEILSRDLLVGLETIGRGFGLRCGNREHEPFWESPASSFITWWAVSSPPSVWGDRRIPEPGIDDAIVHVDQERVFTKVPVLGHLQKADEFLRSGSTWLDVLDLESKFGLFVIEIAQCPPEKSQWI